MPLPRFRHAGCIPKSYEEIRLFCNGIFERLPILRGRGPSRRPVPKRVHRPGCWNLSSVEFVQSAGTFRGALESGCRSPKWDRGNTGYITSRDRKSDSSDHRFEPPAKNKRISRTIRYGTFQKQDLRADDRSANNPRDYKKNEFQ